MGHQDITRGTELQLLYCIINNITVLLVTMTATIFWGLLTVCKALRYNLHTLF